MHGKYLLPVSDNGKNSPAVNSGTINVNGAACVKQDTNPLPFRDGEPAGPASFPFLGPGMAIGLHIVRNWPEIVAAIVFP
ncbi:hypothetical protein EGT74_16275 [Chitinophaga lutea]|uniref:Uncharacterized protein n=1 Tax=Chitinophaga lutea TaxID=2488634 RepID=A0A3N4PX00_9BACT|nr:hypothetical protein [Chitinophaga lutea]RPE08597.1 hypothetical protein EGT74_16275 [Chitinophaga lutea]